MPTYKLTYFNFTGLGEPIRMMFHYGGVDFEDVRVSFEDWPALKPTMPMEEMPILEIDGKVYHQSRAISRYLAKKFNLHGVDDLEAIEIDAAVDDIEDWRLAYAFFFREKDEAKKAELMKKANEKTPWALAKFEEQVKKNGGFFVNGRMTWPDIYFTSMMDSMDKVSQIDFLKDFPTLKKLTETVRAEPKIKAYLDKRPKTII